MRSTSSSDARPRSFTLGQRATNFSKYGATDLTPVCCSMTSDNHTRYGSAAIPGATRHGSFRPCRSYHASSSTGREAAASGWEEETFFRLAAAPDRLMGDMVAKRFPMSKPGPISAKPLSVLLSDVFSDAYAKQGFAARELVTRWAEIAGPEVAAHSEPLKIQWPRPVEGQAQEPATLVLRVEGPMALEIQHTSDVILQRVNRFFGWSAVGRLALRQAPLSRRDRAKAPGGAGPAALGEGGNTLSSVQDEDLRTALARLGAAIKRN